MISRSGDLITFECDGEKCHEVLETGTYSFSLAAQRMREAEWTVVRTNNAWHHYCSDCEETRRKEKQAKMAELAKKFQGE